jgi:hypothetical protein
MCDCADCRTYRVWRAEGTDEWQPNSEGWDTWSTATDPSAVDGDTTDTYSPADALTSF